MTNLRVRIASAVVLGTVVVVATIYGGVPFSLVATLVAMFVWSEWIDISAPDSDDRIRLSGHILLGLVFLAAVFMSNANLLVAGIALFAVMAAAAWMLRGGNWPIAGFAYAGGTLIAMIMLRNSPPDASGLTAILFLFAVVWATDIGAYFAGRRIGGPKIYPAVSPNKTWSGGIGGIASAVIAGVAVFLVAGLPNLGSAIVLGIVLSVVSQVGDFFESWMKRRSGLKDSSHILPGHGGLMDRVDGLVFAAIALWLLSLTLSGAARPASAFF